MPNSSQIDRYEINNLNPSISLLITIKYISLKDTHCSEYKGRKEVKQQKIGWSLLEMEENGPKETAYNKRAQQQPKREVQMKLTAQKKTPE